MSRPSRRPKRRTASRKAATFAIVVEAQPMTVRYRPRWMADQAMFEFRSPHKPPRRIPVSETGYLCHFAPMDEVKAAASPRDFAREVALDIILSRCKWRPEDRNQLSLF
jgi:hypothetical protein